MCHPPTQLECSGHSSSEQKVDLWGGGELAQGRSCDGGRRAGVLLVPCSSQYLLGVFALQVSLDFVKSGSYELERMGVTYPAQAHTKSPFDPDNKRVKGFY